MHIEQQQIRAGRFSVIVSLLNEAYGLFAVPRYMQNMIEALIPKSNADDADISRRILRQQNLVWSYFGRHSGPSPLFTAPCEVGSYTFRLATSRTLIYFTQCRPI